MNKTNWVSFGCYLLGLLLSVQCQCSLLLSFKFAHNPRSCKLNLQTFVFLTFYCIFLTTYFKLFESICLQNSCKYREWKVDLCYNTFSLIIYNEFFLPSLLPVPLNFLYLPFVPSVPARERTPAGSWKYIGSLAALGRSRLHSISLCACFVCWLPSSFAFPFNKKFCVTLLYDKPPQ